MIKKINIPTDNVVIGSNTIEEHKFQILNFMNMLYNIAFNGDNRGNINPWINNLKYEISWVRWNKYYTTYGFRIEHHIEILRTKLITNQIKEKDWEDLLHALTKMFELKYTLN